MIKGILIAVVSAILIVIVYIGYRMGTSDQKYERDTGRDFASHRDNDMGGHFGGGYGGGYRGGRGSSLDYDSRPDPYDLNEPDEEEPAIPEAEEEEEYEDFSEDETRMPEF